MRKIYIFDMITIDGFFEGPQNEIDWHTVDKEFNEFAERQLNETDIILFGRVTYDLMAQYWPTEYAIKNDPIIEGKMNEIPKIVFSSTLEKADWNNTRIIKENIAEEVSQLKHQSGKELAIFGSSDLAATFIQSGLIDEYRIMINPVILGSGKSVFKGISDRHTLKLIKTKTFQSGNILLYYQPDRKEQLPLPWVEQYSSRNVNYRRQHHTPLRNK
jgi:dihydrofolate reductase